MKTNSRGFTLLEVMIVLGIVAGLVVLGLPKIQNNQNKIKTVIRQFATLSRETRNQARLKRMTYRIAIRMDSKPAYWVEHAPGNVLIPSEATLERMRHLDDKEKPANPFQKATNLIKEEKELPSGVKFKSVETISNDEEITEGMAYIYYTPEGLVEKSIVQIANDKDATWSLIFNPLTGHADIVEKSIRLKDLKFE